MNELSSSNSFFISHHPQWSEAFFGIEHANKYSISDSTGQEILFAHEEKGSFLKRFFMQNTRPFVINVFNREQKLLFKVNRPFRFIWQECSAVTELGETLGSIRMRWAFFSKKYDITDSTDQVIFTIQSPMLKPWTYFIYKMDKQVGLITKKWTGFKKELFTTADNFGLQLDTNASDKEKSLLLSAVFLIDFMYFEKKN